MPVLWQQSSNRNQQARTLHQRPRCFLPENHKSGSKTARPNAFLARFNNKESSNVFTQGWPDIVNKICAHKNPLDHALCLTE